jgi:hypothetical protein
MKPFLALSLRRILPCSSRSQLLHRSDRALALDANTTVECFGGFATFGGFVALVFDFFSSDDAEPDFGALRSCGSTFVPSFFV